MPRKTVAMMAAEEQNRRALELAVREHERQQELQDEVDARRMMGERERAQTHRAPQMAPHLSGEPYSMQLGLAQPGQLHQQDMRKYDPAYTDAANPANQPTLTPAQQEALDAQLDYNADYLYRDEAGNERLRQRPLSDTGLAPPPVAVERGLASLEADRYAEKPTKKPKLMKVRI